MLEMKETLEIRNFGSIREATFENLEEFVLIVGQNGSGKSTLMRLIKSMRELCTIANVYSVLNLPHLHKINYNGKNDADVFKKNRIEHLLGRETRINYTNGSFVYEFDANSYRRENFCNLKIKPEDRVFIKSTYKNVERDFLSMFLDNEISFIGVYSNICEMYDDFLSEIKDFTSVNIPFLRCSCVKEKNKLYEKIHSENLRFRISEAPSSFQSVFPIVLFFESILGDDMLNEIKRSIISVLLENNCVNQYSDTYMSYEMTLMKPIVDVYIEEPEQHLFPKQQTDFMCLIMKYLMKIREKKEVFSTISTNSVVVLGLMNALFRCFDENKILNGACLNFDKTGVYLIENGKIMSAKMKNERKIDVSMLSNSIDKLFINKRK